MVALGFILEELPDEDLGATAFEPGGGEASRSRCQDCGAPCDEIFRVGCADDVGRDLCGACTEARLEAVRRFG